MGLFGRKKDGDRKRFTRIFFATDLHGSDDCFRKLLSAATVYKADALVVGGDITGKQVVPIVRQRDGSYTCSFLGREQRLASEEEAGRQATLVTRAGNYPYLTDADEVAELSAAPERVDELTHRLVRERVQAWVELADAKLKDTGVPLYMCGGNDDFFEIDEILDAGESVTAASSTSTSRTR